MLVGKVKKTLLIPAFLILIVIAFVFSTRGEKVDFSSQVKPIINKKCIACHGGVKKEGGFSLLFRD